MKIKDIKNMSHEHLENLAEYIIRQDSTHINCAPYHYKEDRKRAWVHGFDCSRHILIEAMEDHRKLIEKLPMKD